MKSEFEFEFEFDPSKEIMLNADLNNKYNLFPLKFPDIMALAKTGMSAHWVAEEIKYNDDITDWEEKLNNDERFFLKNILAFFSISDGIVNENLAINFYNEIKVPEAKYLYANQIQMEAIHSETYSLLIDTYIKDVNEKDRLNNALDNSVIIKKKADWALKWLDNSNIFPERLIAFIFVEGIFFSGAFCSIFWLKNRKLMPALVKANKFISKDEKFHCDAGILFYSKLIQRLPEKTVHSIFKEAIEIEQEFITESIPVSLLGMNSNKMIEYIKYVGDNLLVRLGYNKVSNAKNPFPWMDTSALESKNNMFEHVGSEYAKANVGNDSKENEIDFDLDL